MDLGIALMHDARTESHELIDDAIDGVLIARDQGGREDHGVAGLQHDAAVLAVSHARQRRHGLALGSGSHQDALVRRQGGDVLGVDEHAVGDPEIAALGRNAHIAHHRTAHQGHTAPVERRSIEYLLDAVNMTGEGGHDDLLVRLGEDVVEHRADLVLMTDHAGHLGVGGVHAEQVHALIAEPREGPQIGDAPVDGQRVDLEITGDQYIAGVGSDHGRHRIGDGVVDGDEFEVEGFVGHRLVLLDHT